MTELGNILERLGLDQYLDALVGEGFDTWETVLDIQESDLDALNVKLGHRRKLQREIATYRGVPYERLVGSPAHEAPSETTKAADAAQGGSQPGDKGAASTGETKRKYRRHPKPDENAPERPPSAYVIFSNKIREEIKGENLSFTAIAKLVGDRWQKLDPAEKEPYEEQAAAAKEHYTIQHSAYKKTDAYKEYMQYLTDFKAKHAGPADGKRPKLDKESSGGSTSAKSGEMVDLGSGHRRAGSIGSMSSTSFANPFPSPGVLPLAFAVTSNQVLGMRKPTGTSPHTESPPAQLAGVPKLRSAISTQSSTSDDSWISRGDQADAVQRTAQLSLATAPSTYATLTTLPPFENSSSDDSGRLSARRPYFAGHREALPPLNPDPAAYQQYRPALPGMLPAATADERWRMAMPDNKPRATSEASRVFHPALPMSQSGSFGSAKLPPLISPERPSDTTHDLLQRTLPPPRLSSPPDRPRRLSGVSRGAGTPGQSGAGTPIAGRRGGEATHLDQSESDAISTLAGLASTGTKGEGAERPDARLARR